MDNANNSAPKIALITGGSRGLGKDTVLSLARKGVDILFTYRTRADEAAKVEEEIREMGRTARAFQLDTGKVATFDAFFADVAGYLRETTGQPRFDFLVNNAGSALWSTIEQTGEEDFDNIVNIHYKGVFFLTQKALPMIADGGGIVNISSGLARFSTPGVSVYASMKGAVEVLTRYMARELGSRRIRANVVAPGAIATDFAGGRVRDNQEVNDDIAGITALGRVGVPEDIGSVVAFLCTEEARWINGQRIEVSGGVNL